jgi:RNA recognition motif-containing protein
MNGNTIFISNIDYNGNDDEEALRALCQRIGPVKSFRAEYDRETNRLKDVAFCEYYNKDDQIGAIFCLNNYEFNGRRLNVINATPSIDDLKAEIAKLKEQYRLQNQEIDRLREQLAESKTQQNTSKIRESKRFRKEFLDMINYVIPDEKTKSPNNNKRTRINRPKDAKQVVRAM